MEEDIKSIGNLPIKITNPPSRRFITLYLSVLGLAGFFIIWLATSQYGIAIGPDGVNYISSARNLAAGKGYIRYNGHYFVSWPPLYPSILALGALFRIDPIDGARIVNTLTFCGIVIAGGFLIARQVQKTLFVYVGAPLLLFSIPLISVSINALSEPLFILLLMASIFALSSFITQKTWLTFTVLVALSASLTLQRYVGVLAVLVYAMILSIHTEWGTLRHRLRTVSLYLLFSLAPLSLYMLRNQLVSGTLTGYRGIATLSLGENVKLSLIIIHQWFFGWFVPSNFFILSGVFLLGLFYAAGYWTYRRVEHLDRRAEWEALVSFAGVYWLFVVLSSTYVGYDEISDRILSPLYPLLFIIAIIVAARFINRMKSTIAQKAVWVLFCLFLAFWYYHHASTIYNKVVYHSRHGAGGYNQPLWRESELLNALKDNRLSGTVFSNIPDVLYLFTPIQAQMAPFRAETMGEFYQKMGDENYLVWHRKTNLDFVYSLEEIQTIFRLEPIQQHGDGDLYRMLKKE